MYNTTVNSAYGNALMKIISQIPAKDKCCLSHALQIRQSTSAGMSHGSVVKDLKEVWPYPITVILHSAIF